MEPEIYDRLSALAEPTRVRLLALLEGEELTVGELVRVVQLPQSTVSRHLKQLHARGWIDRRAVGTASFFRMGALDAGALALWRVVRDEVADAYPEDQQRLATVLALRMVDSATFFERVGGGWDALRRQLFGDDCVTAALLALLPPDLVVADLGCGTGEALAWLAPAVGRAIGVDREQAMLDAAADRLAALDNVDLRRGELAALPLADGELGAALTMLVLHHVVDLPPVFAEVARALAPGGRWVVLDIDEHDRAEYRQTMGHVHLGFSADTLRALGAAAGLALVAHRVLPPAAGALGPPPCVAVLQKQPTAGQGAANR
jgi:SAM-dependent methyltransferase